jgi:hypothetical protein
MFHAGLSFPNDAGSNLQVHIPKEPFGTWQFGKIGVLLKFIFQKLKSKYLVCHANVL